MGRRPFGDAGIVAALHARVERVLQREALQDRPHRAWIVPCRIEIADPEFVGFEFLRTREFERQQLRALQRSLAELLAEPAVAEQNARQDRSGRAEQRVALRRSLAPLRVARRHMTDLMSEDRREFGLIVHQRDQLPRRVDIAAGDGEGVVYRAVEQRNGKRFTCIAEARLDGDVLADLLHILRMAAAHRPAEFGEQLRVRFGAHLRLALRDRRRGAGDIPSAHAAGKRQREGGNGGGCGKLDARHESGLPDCVRAQAFTGPVRSLVI